MNRGSDLRRFTLGTVFLLLVALAAAFSIQTYRKALPWESATDVTLTTPSAGLQLDPPADVKLRGVEVGQVRRITSDGSVATLHIALQKNKLSIIPANIDAQIIPKTLFGEKYVDLVMPVAATSARIQAGAVITQSTTSVETGKVFADLTPILVALQPQQLALTLSALDDALSGRGTEIGNTLADLNSYLTQFTPQLPTLDADLTQLAATAQLYAGNAPALLDALDNVRATSTNLLVPQQSAFDAVLKDTQTFSDEATTVLQANGDRLITLTGQSLPVLQLLATYSSEYPCLIHGLEVTNAVADRAFGGEGPYLKATIDLPGEQHPDYTYPADAASTATSDANVDQLPANIAGYAPHCVQVPTQDEGLPDVAPNTYNTGTTAAAAPSSSTTQNGTTTQNSAQQNGIGSAGSASEQALVAAVTSSTAHVGLLDALIGPLLNGQQVVLP